MATFNKIRGSNGSGEAARATVQSIRLPGSTSLDVDGVANWPSPFIATYGTPDGNGSITPSSLRVFHGTVSGSDIAITSFAAGSTDNGNSVGDIVVLKPSTEWSNELANTLEGIAEGTLIDSNAVTAAKIASNAVTTTKILDSNVTTTKIADDAVTTAKIAYSGVTRFAVTKSTDQTGVTSSVDTKVTFNTEEYDIGSAFASSTFTAPAAGVYHFDATVGVQATTIGNLTGAAVRIYKNGAVHRSGSTFFDNNVTADGMSATISADIKLAAGNTVELYAVGHTVSGTAKFPGAGTYFNGHLVALD